MLRVRLLVGTAFVVFLGGVVILDYLVDVPYPGWLILCLVLGVLAAGELASLVTKITPLSNTWLPYACVVAGIVVQWCPYLVDGSFDLRWPLTLACFAGLAYVALISSMYAFSQSGTLPGALIAGALATVYLGLCASAVASIRWLQDGLFALLYFIVVTKSADTGAYFVGRSLGRHKLAPRISPAKTVEGTIGGIVTAAATGLLFWALFRHSGHALTCPGEATALGGVLGFWGQIGDLFESCLKRQAGVKDSSDWLPGIGGVLDLLDSILWNGPLFAFWWVARSVLN